MRPRLLPPRTQVIAEFDTDKTAAPLLRCTRCASNSGSPGHLIQVGDSIQREYTLRLLSRSLIPLLAEPARPWTYIPRTSGSDNILPANRPSSPRTWDAHSACSMRAPLRLRLRPATATTVSSRDAPRTLSVPPAAFLVRAGADSLAVARIVVKLTCSLAQVHAAFKGVAPG